MRLSFRLKIAVLTSTLAALPLVAAGWLLIDVNAREVESATQANRIALVDSVAERAEAELLPVERTLRAIATAVSDGSLGDDARVALALRLLDAQPSLDLVAIYDREGALIDRMHDPSLAAIETPPALPDDLLAAAREEGRAIGHGALDGGSVRVLVVVPLRPDGELTGFAVTPWSLAGLQAHVDRLSESQLATREGVLSVQHGTRVLVHPDRDRLLSEGLAPGGDPTRAPASGEHTDRDGRTWLETRVGLRSAPWTVIASIPTDVAYASLEEMRRIVLWTIAAALLAALLGALFFARRLTAPIEKLVAFTKDLAARRFDRRVTIATSDELSVLGAALSDAASELERSEATIREQDAIRADLGRYLPGELVEQIIRREQSMELGGQRRPVTVLFADVVAFTPMSDRLPPEQVVAILNELFTLLTEAVFRQEGTVDKFVGDCVMALFGAPAPREDHAARAVATAQDMLRFLESANAGWKDRYGVEIQLAIGINTGDAVVGNVGSEKRMEYTAIGDVVNVAARLETIARPAQILISRAVRDAIGDEFDVLPVGEREVPGRAQPVELFEVPW